MTLAKVISANIISQSKEDRKAKKRVGDWEKIEKAVPGPEFLPPAQSPGEGLSIG